MADRYKIMAKQKKTQPEPQNESDGMSISDLEGMLAGRKKQLKKLVTKRERLQREMDAVEEEIQELHGSATPPGGKRPRNEQNLPDTIEAVMKGSGEKQMRIADIVRGVSDAGYASSSANFRGIVNQTLIKDDRFEQVARGKYALA